MSLILLVDAAGRPLKYSWPILRVWPEGRDAPVPEDREWASSPWATRSDERWALAGRRLWC